MPPNQYKEKKTIEAKPTEAAHDPLKATNLNECPRVRDAPTVKIFWMIFLCMMLGKLRGQLRCKLWAAHERILQKLWEEVHS